MAVASGVWRKGVCTFDGSTEKTILHVLSKLLEGSGWNTILTHSGICTAGSAEALLKVTHIKRAREIHQITASVLYNLAVDEYDQSYPDEEVSFEAWLQERAQESPTFKFWMTVLNLEILLLTFVRSVRLGNYEEYKESLKQMMPWFFLFDHQNYSRWLAVHILDLEQLPRTAPEIHSHFMEGRFVIHKTSNLFNGLGIDHAHEQNNAIVKGKGGAIGLTHDPSSLRRWTIGGPEVARLLDEFHGCSEDDDFGFHHEQKESYQIRVLEHTIALKDAFQEYDNPFSINSPELIALDTRAAVSDEGVANLMNAEEKGSELYMNFINERLLGNSKSIHEPITKCQTLIFAAKKKPSQSSLTRTLRSDFNLFSRSFIVSVARNLDLDEFFAHENQMCPPSLTLNGEMRSGDKAQLTLLLEKLIASDTGNQLPQDFDALLVDGAVLVHSVKPRSDVRTFEDYVVQLDRHLRSFVDSFGVKRIDIAWDLYLPNSLKKDTRTGRGAGVRRVDLPNKNKLPTDWANYLRNDLNKQELFRYLGRAFLDRFNDILFVTNVDCDLMASESTTSALNGISCSTMEEADGRLALHLQDTVENGAQNVLVRSSDTDVLVILVSFFPQLQQKGLKQLWLLFGAGPKRRYISVHGIAEALGEDMAEALRGFHAFTGCDFTSFFCGKGKRSAYAALDQAAIEAFKQLSNPVQVIPAAVLESLETFTVRMYGVHRDTEGNFPTVNQARKQLFASDTKLISALPPTHGAFIQKVRRAAYVAGHIWGCALNSEGTTMSPEGWGWTVGPNGAWSIVWSLLPIIWQAVRALDRCGCTTGCHTLRCLCRRYGLPCSPACKVCQGTCGNGRQAIENEADIAILGNP